MIDDHTGVMDLEAAGGTGGRKVEHHGFQAPVLSPKWQILMEEEVTTPPRGGRPPPVTQVPPGGVRAMPQICTEVRPRDGGLNCQKDVGSPVDRLVDAVARMQVDLADLRAENRMLRTPSVPQVIRAPRQVFDAIVSLNGWDNDTAALQLFSHLEGDALNVALIVPLPRRLSRTGLVGASPLRITGSVSRLPETV